MEESVLNYQIQLDALQSRIIDSEEENFSLKKANEALKKDISLLKLDSAHMIKSTVERIVHGGALSRRRTSRWKGGIFKGGLDAANDHGVIKSKVEMKEDLLSGEAFKRPRSKADSNLRRYSTNRLMKMTLEAQNKF